MSCNGDCCVAFPLGAGPDILRSGKVLDGDMVAFMTRPLTDEEARERRARFGLAAPTVGTVYHRCVYWDEQTRLCGAYEHRPDMCRRYPYGRECDHGCDCTDGAEDPAAEGSPLRVSWWRP